MNKIITGNAENINDRLEKANNNGWKAVVFERWLSHTGFPYFSVLMEKPNA